MTSQELCDTLILYFRKHAAENPNDEQWKRGLAVSEKWFSFMRTPPDQIQIDSLIQELSAEENPGSGWIELAMAFQSWAKESGFKIK